MFRDHAVNNHIRPRSLSSSSVVTSPPTSPHKTNFSTSSSRRTIVSQCGNIAGTPDLGPNMANFSPTSDISTETMYSAKSRQSWQEENNEGEYFINMFLFSIFKWYWNFYSFFVFEAIELVFAVTFSFALFYSLSLKQFFWKIWPLNFPAFLM